MSPRAILFGLLFSLPLWVGLFIAAYLTLSIGHVYMGVAK